MFRIIRFLISIAFVVALGLVAVTVPLGERTLWGHIKAIAGSSESKRLVEGVKKKASKVIDGDSDQLTPAERRKLRKLIRERLDDDSKPTDARAKK